MAARKPAVVRGLEFKISPAWWLRRWTRFPFYFESHNPSFRVYVERVEEAAEQWPENKIEFEIVFANGTLRTWRCDVPSLEFGEGAMLVIEHILTTYPGQTMIRIPIEKAPMMSMRRETFADLYSYDVGRETSIWLGAVGFLLIMLTLVSTLAGVGLIGPSDTPVNNITVIVPTPAPAKSP